MYYHFKKCNNKYKVGNTKVGDPPADSSNLKSCHYNFQWERVKKFNVDLRALWNRPQKTLKK